MKHKPGHKFFDGHDWIEEGRQLLLLRHPRQPVGTGAPITLIAWTCSICGKTTETKRAGHWPDAVVSAPKPNPFA
jgi:hypothetical protein